MRTTFQLHAVTMAAALVGFLSTGCDRVEPAGTGDPGEPVPGLSEAELGRFHSGHALFNHVFTDDKGLGPAFNENQCSACHTSPASGGFGGERVLKASRWQNGACDPLEARGGGNVRRKVTPPGRAAGIAIEAVPDSATEGRFTAPPLYGFGFADAIPIASLEALADPDDRDGDGISGRLGSAAIGRSGRFGRKADMATLADFVAGAAHLEMGLTSSVHPEDQAQGQPIDGAIDGVAGPELDDRSLALIVDYVRFLAPVGRGGPPAGWNAEQVTEGGRHFRSIGCPSCHVPTMETGESESPALSRRRVAFYSDFLLHDMGPPLADICTAGASPAEIRTEPLMGLRLRDLLMHDGRTNDLRQAILLHGGEGSASRDAFRQLPLGAQEALLAFLKTL